MSGSYFTNTGKYQQWCECVTDLFPSHRRGEFFKKFDSFEKSLDAARCALRLYNIWHEIKELPGTGSSGSDYGFDDLRSDFSYLRIYYWPEIRKFYQRETKIWLWSEGKWSENWKKLKETEVNLAFEEFLDAVLSWCRAEFEQLTAGRRAQLYDTASNLRGKDFQKKRRNVIWYASDQGPAKSEFTRRWVNILSRTSRSKRMKMERK